MPSARHPHETLMAELPPKLREYLDDFAFISSREERIDYLIDIADEFKAVPASIATQPYDEAHRVIGCESEAFVWAIDRPDGTLDFYFDVLNPQGLSAMALSAILDQACSGAPLDQVAAVNGEGCLHLLRPGYLHGQGTRINRADQRRRLSG